MKKVKTIALFGLLLSILCVIVPLCLSCANDAGGDAIKDTEGSGTTETAKQPHIMPERDYGGYDFKFLVKEFDGNGYWGAVDIYAEAENGDPINDSVYRRNSIIEERYNIKISEVRAGSHGEVAEKARIIIQTGTHEYDAIMPSLTSISSLATSGFLLDVRSTMPELKLDQVWWDQRANQMLALGGRQYFLIGDMTLMTNDATWVIMYNKTVAEEYGLGNLYSYVKDDDWNFDTFSALVKTVSKDLNGDGKFDENDQVGLLTTGSEASLIMVYNTGEMAARKDANDLPYLSLNTERTITAAEKVFGILSGKTTCVQTEYLSHISDPWTNGINKMFQENKGLFYLLSLTIMHKMRGMNSDFGVLPFPKLDKLQTEFYHTVQASTSNSIVFPVTTPDTEMASIIIEDMCYESRDTVRYAYFDITITNKTIRDEESAQMLDLIFSTRIYDLGYIFNWGDIGTMIAAIYPDAGKFASYYETLESKAQAAMEKTIEEINKIT